MRKLFFLVVLMACPAFAADKPPVIASYIHAQTPHGQGTMSKLWIKAYEATLWMDAPSWSMEVPFALTLRYDMDFDREDLVDRSLEEIQHATPLSKEEKANYTTQLNAIFPASVNEGDAITALFVPKKGIRFYYNDQASGSITDPVFAQRFFAIWFAPTTTEPALRKALLKS